jgi:hypothetical protein
MRSMCAAEVTGRCWQRPSSGATSTSAHAAAVLHLLGLGWRGLSWNDFGWRVLDWDLGVVEVTQGQQ